MKILAINPGGTSMRVTMYDDLKEVWNEHIVLDEDFIKSYPVIKDQFEGRLNAIINLLKEKGEDLNDVAAIAARGGNLLGIEAGAYEVTEEMLQRLKEADIDHASNLGAPLAYSIGNLLGIKSYIYDAVTADELNDVSRITGINEIRRRGRAHNLNMRAMAIETAKIIGKDYNKANILIAHLGSGFSFAIHSNGRIIDVISDDEGAFSPERAGFIPPYRLIDLIFEHKYTKNEIMTVLTRSGGLMSLMGSTDFLKLEKAFDSGDEWSNIVYEAMALNVAKSIGKLSVVVSGKVDAITLTGTIAYSQKFTGKIKDRVEFIAPVHVLAGEHEMVSLAGGIYRVINGEENARKI
ncbi:butyrate kinase 2 [Oxobacter pfennigii]|uniref:Probable butyrate kinase n=1 Tax=Oxobacter pfennigii TaxID=36849 RepID=A0A0P8YYM0_9CLOT|nr:butyrate kinase [Oxobacter pfennigii]KPU44892.1 butyrate kinase 2 [Oxobacter pfennigii]